VREICGDVGGACADEGRSALPARHAHGARPADELQGEALIRVVEVEAQHPRGWDTITSL